jgi:murein DD-endopeptidase MepM/ murein hydrolase activator NlpD
MTTFMLPFPDSKLTGHFGKVRRIKGVPTTPHRGTDWGVKEGTPIPAVSNGTVRLVQWSNILGWVLVQSVIDKNGKVFYVGYCHLKDKPKLIAGQKVAMGDTIGLCGNTGSASSGPHLHATLSPALKGVFQGTVLDLHAFILEQLEKPSTGRTRAKKTTTTTKKPSKTAKP